MKSLRTVIQGLPVKLVGVHATSLSVIMNLRYEPSDPYVVHAAFTPMSTATSRWNGSSGATC